MPYTLVFTALQPIVFALLFRYVFGEAFAVPGDYVDFLMPGVFALAVAFGAITTAIKLAADLETGAIGRFRSLPMARSAVLIGHTSADLLRSVLVLALIVAVGFLIGFDFRTSWSAFLAGVGLILALSYALIWAFALVGVLAPSAVSAEAMAFPALFPLTFASSAFVPADSMPSWLQVFSEHQPVTAVVDASRALMLGGPTTDAVLIAGCGSPACWRCSPRSPFAATGAPSEAARALSGDRHRMTATTSSASAPPERARLGWAISDGWEMARRSLLHVVRAPFMIAFTALQPIMFALLFRYAFGGAFEPSSAPGDYVDFLMPGVFVMAMAFGAMATASGLASDLETAAIDRFRSLPMARSAVLVGHTSAELARSALILALIVAMGFAIGFDVHTDWLAFVAGIGLVLAFAYALIWVLALVGVVASNVQTAEGAVFQLLFPLTFASSAFVPTDAMPDWLQVFTDHQPVTAVVEASRALMLGGPTADVMVTALAWVAGMLIVFPPLAAHHYRRRVE